MKIKCVAVGKSMPAWIEQGCQTYQKRLQHHWPVEIIEVEPAKRQKSPSNTSSLSKQYKLSEATQIQRHIGERDKLIITAIEGKTLSTEAFAKQCDQWQSSGQSLCFVIGGPDGIDDGLKQQADYAWSLSPLTLPHPLVRIVLLEQLYRAWSLLQGHPYHRA